MAQIGSEWTRMDHIWPRLTRMDHIGPRLTRMDQLGRPANLVGMCQRLYATCHHKLSVLNCKVNSDGRSHHLLTRNLSDSRGSICSFHWPTCLQGRRLSGIYRNSGNFDRPKIDSKLPGLLFIFICLHSTPPILRIFRYFRKISLAFLCPFPADNDIRSQRRDGMEISWRSQGRVKCTLEGAFLPS